MNPQNLIAFAFYAVVVLFLGLYLQRVDWDQIGRVDLSIGYFGVASLLALAFRYWGACVWQVILKRLAAGNFRRSEMFFVYAKAWLGRYVPGTAPWILARIHFASMHGVPRSKSVVSSLLEGGLQVIVLLLVSLIILMFDARIRDNLGITFGLVFVALVPALLFLPFLFNPLVSTMYRAVKGRELSDDHRIDRGTIALLAAMFVVGSLISGVSQVLLTFSIHPEVGFNNFFYIFASCNLAGAIGALAIFVPSGIGVREGVQLILLSVIMPLEIAVLVTATMRLWSVSVDVLFLIVASACWHRKKQSLRGAGALE